MDHPLNCSNQLHLELKLWSQFFFSVSKDSKILTSELPSEEEVTLLKSMPSDNPSQRELLLTTKNLSTKHKKDKSKNFFFNTTELSWSLTQEDASPRNMVDQVPEPDIKNLTDDCSFIKLSSYYYLLYTIYLLLTSYLLLLTYYIL